MFGIMNQHHHRRCNSGVDLHVSAINGTFPGSAMVGLVDSSLFLWAVSLFSHDDVLLSHVSP